MKITYNFNQWFELKEIDLSENKLIFITNNGMGKFDSQQDKLIEFSIYFEHIEQLNNITKLLWEYLDKKDLIYWCD